MQNPYTYHLPVQDDALFVGRQAFLAKILSGLRTPMPCSAAVLGGRRCGKSSLLLKLARMLQEQPWTDGGRLCIPCLLDMHEGRPLDSSQDFFWWALEELGSRLTQHDAALLTELQEHYHQEINRGPVRAFASSYRKLTRQTGNTSVRLILLIDESEKLTSTPWGKDVSANLRYLVSISEICREIALVMSGATEFYATTTQKDSPLKNVLTRYCLHVLERTAIVQLACRAGDRSPNQPVVDEIWLESGGHPCLAQFLLYELWDILPTATLDDVRRVAISFDTATGHFTSWQDRIGDVGRQVYMWLVRQQSPVAYATIRHACPDVDGWELEKALDILEFHGVINHQEEGQERYFQTAGRMYRNWFVERHMPLQKWHIRISAGTSMRRKSLMPNTFTHGYALIIGVGTSQVPSWSLPVTVRDAEALQRVLMDPTRCAYSDSSDRIRLLSNEIATKEEILAGLDWLENQVQSDLNSTAIVYFSGHGWRDQHNDRYYLIPHDVQENDIPGSALEGEDFASALSTVRPAKLIVLLDCCHAGGMVKNGESAMPVGFAKSAPPDIMMGALAVGQGRVVISSSTGQEYSWVQPDGTLSIFTHHLLEALSGQASTTNPPAVGILDVFNYLGLKVPESARQHTDPVTGRLAQQHPLLDCEKADNFPIALLGIVEPRQIEYDSGAVRRMLRAAFKGDARGLRSLCNDHPLLRDVVNQVDDQPNLNEIVDELINHCDRHLVWEEMIFEVRKSRSRQFKQFERQLRRTTLERVER